MKMKTKDKQRLIEQIMKSNPDKRYEIDDDGNLIELMRLEDHI